MEGREMLCQVLGLPFGGICDVDPGQIIPDDGFQIQMLFFFTNLGQCHCLPLLL